MGSFQGQNQLLHYLRIHVNSEKDNTFITGDKVFKMCYFFKI